MGMRPMTIHEVLAVTRLRQWRAERSAVHSPKAQTYQRRGWQGRKSTQYDARIVRVLDFERAIEQLTWEQQAALLLHYGERQPQDAVARVLGWSLRKVTYVLPQALAKLAEILDRRDLL